MGKVIGLASRACADSPPGLLDDSTRERLRQQVPGWRVVAPPGGGAMLIQQEWAVKDAESAQRLVDSIRTIAQEQGHDPASVEAVGGTTVVAQLTTAAAGGWRDRDRARAPAQLGKGPSRARALSTKDLRKQRAHTHPRTAVTRAPTRSLMLALTPLPRRPDRGGLYPRGQGEQPGPQHPPAQEEAALLGLRPPGARGARRPRACRLCNKTLIRRIQSLRLLCYLSPGAPAGTACLASGVPGRWQRWRQLSLSLSLLLLPLSCCVSLMRRRRSLPLKLSLLPSHLAL